jgi:hypothetical protein
MPIIGIGYEDATFSTNFGLTGSRVTFSIASSVMASVFAFRRFKLVHASHCGSHSLPFMQAAILSRTQEASVPQRKPR